MSRLQKFPREADWYNSNVTLSLTLLLTLGTETGLKLVADVEWQMYLSFPPVSLIVRVPPTGIYRHALYPCPKSDMHCSII
jgi:hypothetical protein